MDKTQIEKLFGRYINEGQVKYLKAGHLDVQETKREGITFTDPYSGQQLIDCFSSAGSFNTGRKNKELLAVLEKALDEYDMGNYNLVSKPKVDFAKKLISLCPGDINHILFAAGGGDAVDGAIKLARGSTGKQEIISTIKAYHGHTGFALSANGKEHYRKYFEPLMPGFTFVPFGDLDAMKAAATKNTAAIIIEPIQGEAGIFVGEDDYLHGLREICDRLNILLIFDEIQTGFGRTGKLFACQHSGVVPDIMTVAKSISGGLFPNAAILYRDRDDLLNFVRKNPDFHPSYVGSTDLGCFVSLKVMEYMETNKLWDDCLKVGEHFKAELIKIKEDNPKIIKEVRGRGLMIGIEYIHEFLGPMMTDALAKNGVFAVYSGNAPQVMRFMVPIVASKEDIDFIIDKVKSAVSDMKTILPFALLAAKIPFLLKMLNNERFQTVSFNFIRRFEDLFQRKKKSSQT
jgi:putrescine aminotransferase